MRRLVLLCLLVACPKRGPDPIDLAMQAALDAADRAWADRGVLGFEAVARALDGVPTERAAHPEVMWRRVRIQVGVGLAETEPAVARRAFARGRELGARCVTAGRRPVRSWEGQLPIGTLAAGYAPCAAWLALAWTRWGGGHDPEAVTLDEPVIAALAQIDVEEPVHVRARAWAQALLDGRSALTSARDLTPAAEALLALALTPEADDAWVAWVDAASLVGSDPVRRPARGPVSPEDRAALGAHGAAAP